MQAGERRDGVARPAQDRAEAILAAARTQFRETGADRTTVDDIAARAGVGKGTVFLYWPSKTRLRDAVLQLELAGHFAALADDLRDDPSLLRLGTVIRREIAAGLDNPDMAPLMAGRPIGTPDRFEPPTRALYRILAVMRAHHLVREVADDEIVMGIEAVLGGALARDFADPDGRDLLLDAVERLVSSSYDREDVDRGAVEAAVPDVVDALEDGIDQLVAAAAPDRPTTARLRPRQRPATARS